MIPTRITRTTIDQDGRAVTILAERTGDGRWVVDGRASVGERAMRRRVCQVEAWTLTEFRLSGLGAAELIPWLVFVAPEDDPERTWDEIELPPAFACWGKESSYLELAADPHPLVIDGTTYTRNNSLVCPFDGDDLTLNEYLHSMRWNDSGSRTYGPDLVFMAGTLQGYGYAQLRHDDPDCYDLDDARVHLLPRVRTPADAALVLLDWAEGWTPGDPEQWVTSRLYQTLMLMAVRDEPAAFGDTDVNSWQLTGWDVGGDSAEFSATFSLDASDREAIVRGIARRADRRLVRWILDGNPPPNGLAAIAHEALVSQMEAVPLMPPMLESPDTNLARGIVEWMPESCTRSAWVETEHPAGNERLVTELLRARAIDTQLGIIRRNDDCLPCRAVACPWERAAAVEAADDAFLAWFVEVGVSTGDLFSPSARWHVPARPGTHAHDLLLMLVADGITAGLWKAFVDDAVEALARLDLVLPADDDDPRLDDGSPDQREAVLKALQAYQRSLS